MALADEGFWGGMLDGADPPELALLLSRPRWMADAACREHPEVTFFPVRGESTASAAKSICRRCLVRVDCEAFAIDHDEVGIWGGTSDRERRTPRNAPRAS